VLERTSTGGDSPATGTCPTGSSANFTIALVTEQSYAESGVFATDKVTRGF
jgi:hypothetical protein